jgi:hypothetical protein
VSNAVAGDSLLSLFFGSQNIMTRSLEVQELALVIAVKRQDPSLLTPDFLRYSGIVPQEWELSREPVRAQQVAQVSYQNGVSILAYPDRTVLVESLSDKDSETVEIPSIAQRYSEVLRNMDYQAIGVNFRGYVSFSGEGAHEYVCKTLLSPGSWQQVGTQPMRAGLNLVYTFGRNQLNLSVQEAMLQLPEQERLPVVLFTANFESQLKGATEVERLGQVQQALEGWRSDLATYQQVVGQFLDAEANNLIPMPAMPV